jgi:hypothetical protein
MALFPTAGPDHTCIGVNSKVGGAKAAFARSEGLPPNETIHEGNARSARGLLARIIALVVIFEVEWADRRGAVADEPELLPDQFGIQRDRGVEDL